MIMLLKNRFIHIILALVFLLAPINAHAQTTFDIDAFNALASRAEKAVYGGQTSNDTLEQLRMSLSSARSAALETQSLRTGRSKIISDQIDALGPIPEDPDSEAKDIAELRASLAKQLAVAKAPLIVAEEAFRRANGLISEIDKTIRERSASAFLKLGVSPLSPNTWGSTISDIKKYFGQVRSEVVQSLNNPSSKVIRSNNLPGIIFFAILGLALTFPATKWVSQNMSIANQRHDAKLKKVSYLAYSCLVFIAPLLGICFLIRSLEMLDIFGYRGEALTQAVMAMSVAVVSSYWLAHNLFKESGLTRELLGIASKRLVGAYSVTILMGVALGLYWLINNLIQTADLSETSIAVMEFPLILIGSYGLITFSQRVKMYRARLISEKRITPISDRLSSLVLMLTLATGLAGPISAAIGYSNIGSKLVFATILTLAVIFALFVIFTLIAFLFSEIIIRNQNKNIQESTSKGSLFNVFLAFILACCAIPLLALIWGARVVDIQDVWLSLKDGIVLGDTRISISDFITFVIIFFIGYTLTRLLQSALRLSVLPNTKIDTGAQNALVTGVGYIGIFFSALIAITSMGLDLSSLAIVAGALSVGIGFGLQAIVSNFLSGIILLVERPIKVGDWIQVGAYSGYVSKIAVRSTTIDTFDQANVIIPNADFISGTVTNMTHLSKRGRVKVPVGVAYDSDPVFVKEILMDIVSSNANILKSPGPSVFLLGFGPDSIDFEIRGILRDVNSITSTRSEINFEILRRFAQEGIEIPFGQRDITIKNAAELGKVFQSKTRKKS
jgi:small-conductance mechanosensitive channel